MRLNVMMIVLVLVCLNCKEDTEKVFLQQDQIQIVQPRLEATNQLIDSITGATLSADLKLKGAIIYYTSNGETPSTESSRYTTPIKVTKPRIYKFRAFHPDWKASEVVQMAFHKKGLVIDTIVWHSQASQSYKGVGNLTLNNNRKAIVDFKDPQWLGFDTIASATMRFKKETYVQSLSVGYLSDPGSWIFPPEDVTVSISRNGTDFSSKTQKINPLESMSGPSLNTIDINIDAHVKAIKVEVNNIKSIPEWHEGKGNKAWLFMDEWILK